MKQLKKLLLLVSVFALLSLSACSNNQDTKGEENTQVEETSQNTQEETQEKINEGSQEEERTDTQDSQVQASLSEWDGQWNSLSAYIDDPVIEEALEKEAEVHGETLEEVKEEALESRNSDFGGLDIQGDTVKFYQGRVDEGDLLYEASYEFVESISMDHGGTSMYWFIFENQGDQGPKILAMMDVHGEDTMAHYHMRYLDSVEELNQDDDWYPTYVKSDMPVEDVAGELSHDH